jgi:hypothetical protein
MNKLLLAITLILIIVYIYTLPCKNQYDILPEHFTNTSLKILPSLNAVDTSDINYENSTNDIISHKMNTNNGDMSNDLKKETINQTIDNNPNNHQNINIETSSANMLSSFGTINPTVVSDMMSNFNAMNTDEHKIKDDFINMMSSDTNKDNKECKTTKSCSVKTCGSEDLYPVLDPTFNMREAAKQCILLEDHLNNLKKRCNDCIRKHFLTVDGFLEESVSLEKDISRRGYYRNLHLEWVKIEKLYAENPLDSDNLDNISQKIRHFRKPLVAEYFDTVSNYDV